MVERQVLAPLRDRTFFNLAELNRALDELAEKLTVDRSRSSTGAGVRSSRSWTDRP